MWTTTIAVDDPDQVHDEDSQLLCGDGKSLRMENETVPGTTTDRSKNECTSPRTTSNARRNTRHLLFFTRHLPVLRMTAIVLDL